MPSEETSRRWRPACVVLKRTGASLHRTGGAWCRPDRDRVLRPPPIPCNLSTSCFTVGDGPGPIRAGKGAWRMAGTTNKPPDVLRDLLVYLLREAAEIEHQLMIQYLYAAFSMKKRPDETCTPAQFEAVRRWQSTVYMVARQEMEHLALVNGMLTAIGAEPFFDRQNIPLQFHYYLGRNLKEGKALPEQPCDIPFLFERFNLEVIKRF